MRLLAAREIWNDSIAFLLFDQVDGVRKSVKVTLETVEYPSGYLIEPSFRINSTDAQVLIDSLWDCGLRPTEGTGSAGALKATQEHLSDMQKLVWKLIEPK